MDFNFDTGTIFDGIQTIDVTVLPPLGGTAGVLTIAGDGALILPRGATGARPVTPAAAMLRYNDNSTALEYYDGTSWIQLSVGGGTVTSVAATSSSSGLSITGSPITSSGTLNFTLSTELQGLSAISGTGIITNIAPGSYASRTITGTSGNIVVTDGDGVAGNPTINLATVTNPGSGGTFVKVTTDSFGRVTNSTAVVQADITTLVDAVYVNVTGDSMSGNLTFTGGSTVTGLPTPANATDAANKAYVDAVASSISIHNSVEVGTTAPLTVTYFNGSLGVGSTLTNAGTQAAFSLDGYTGLSVGSRVLIKDQTSQIQNGVYVITDMGSASTNWVLTRAADFDNSVPGEVHPGDFVFITEGNTLASTGWIETGIGTGVNDAIIIGTDPIIFSQFSGAGTYSAGTGLNLTGTVFSLQTPVSTVHGGTGTNSAPTAGQVLIGTSSGDFSPALITAGSGIAVNSASGSISIDNTGVTSITGTASQITASASTGAVTLSLPSSISTGSLTLTGLTANSFLYSGSAGLLTSTAAPTNGQVLIGSTGGAPVAATLTGGTGISITNGPGTITIDSTGGTVTSIDVSGGTTGLTFTGGPVTTSGTITMAGTLSPSNGGTGLSSLGTANQVLGVNNAGTLPEYKTVSAGTGISVTNAAGTISIANTGVTSVGLLDASATPIYNVTGTPVTTTGTLTLTLTSQTANTAFLAPNGSAGQPSFRAIAYADLPLKLYVEKAVAQVAPQATGNNSVAIGSGSVASGEGSFAEGDGANATMFGQKAYANGSFSSAGDAQYGVYVLRSATTDATTTELFLDGTGGSQVITLPNNSLFTFDILVAGRRTDAVGGGAGYRFVGVIRKDATSGSITFVGTPSKTILGETNTQWDAAVLADTSNGSLKVTVTGQIAKTIRWVATVMTTEVTN